MAKNSFAAKRGLQLTVLLAATVLVWGFSDIIQDGRNEREEDTTLAERVKTLEILLNQQGILLHQQTEKLSRQETLLYQQAEKLLQQERLLSIHTEKLSVQDILLRTVTQQDTLLRQQGEELSQQDNAIRQLKQAVTRLDVDHVQETFETQSPQTSFHIPNSKANEGEEVWTEGSRPDSGINTEVTGLHDVEVRSDDSGPLEAVISQMGQRLTEISADVQALKSQTTTDRQKIQDAHTSTYVHWGSSHCSSGSQQVYSGVVGGSYYTHSGAATNYLCLTMSPVLSDHATSRYTYLYGGEYETDDSHNNKDPLCAVCRSSHSTTIMIPGTNVCTPGWHRQYSGYLMAGAYTHVAGTEFICVDSSMEGRPGSNSDQDGKLLYLTKTVCGSLPCDPYSSGKVVTCVVCSL